MYGYRDKTVFCKLHPHKRCEHFCEVHTILLCSTCLREKHRDCKIVEDHEFKAFYSKKIRHASNEIEAEKNSLLGNTDGTAHALDTGLTRLSHFREDLDALISRMSAMKGEIDYQREEMQKISQSLTDIEHSTTTATELRHCKQLYAGVDSEKEKFQRREIKVLHLPTKFRDEIASSIFHLHKKLKNIRNDLTSELNSIHMRQQYGGSPLPKLKEANSLYLDVQEKVAHKRSPNFLSPEIQGRDSRRSFFEKRQVDVKYAEREGRDSRRSLGLAEKEGRDSRRSGVTDNERFTRESRLQAALKLPQVHFQSKTPKPRDLPPINVTTLKKDEVTPRKDTTPRQGGATPRLKFTTYRPPSRPVDIKWTWK